MDHFEKNIKRNPITQDDRDRLLQKDFENLKDGGYTARLAIWAYVEKDIPIPNELKPILREILLTKFPARKSNDTKNKWSDMKREVAFHFVLFGGTQESVIEQVAQDNNEKFETLRSRIFENDEYQKFKDKLLELLDQN